MTIITSRQNKIKFLILFIGSFSILSCDPHYSAIIVNNLKSDIKVKIQYDSESLNKVLKKEDVIPYLKNTIQNEETLISLDTINLISEIKMLSNDSLEIDGGRGFSPRFGQIKNITIYTNKIINLQDKEEIINSFEKKGNLFIMEINLP